MRLLLLLSLYFLSATSFSQEIPAEGQKFMLYLYDVTSSDSTAHITKEKLLQAKELYTNYPWAKIKAIEIYPANSALPGKIFTPGEKNTVSAEMLKYFESLQPGSSIVISPKVVGPKNRPVKWPEINIVLSE